MKMFTFMENYRRYGAAVNTHDVMKTVAIILMIVDHLGMFFDPHNMWWRVVGRSCVPIWLFFMGYRSTGKSTEEELKFFALLLIALDICTVQKIFPLNIFVTVMACRFFMRRIEKADIKPYYFPAIIILCLLMHPFAMLLFEYGGLAVMYAYCGFLHRRYPGSKSTVSCLVVTGVLFALVQIDIFYLTWAQSIVMVTLIALATWFLSRFAHHDVPIPQKGVGTTLKFMGRNTMYIYFLHYALMLILATLLNPPEAFKIRFFI